MRWNVEGADRDSGEELTVQIEAETSEQAETAAAARGLLVSVVYPDEPMSPAEALARMLGEPADVPKRAAAPPPPPPRTQRPAPRVAPMPPPLPQPPPTIPYRSATTTTDAAKPWERQIPTYSGLKIAAYLLYAFAGLSYLVGLMSLSVSVWTLTFGTGTRLVPGIAGIVLIIIDFLVPLAGGALLHGTAAGCIALRDIARNSFK